ncbi:hypothetical protein V3C99_018142, partial [Haemonchus contortus]
MSLCSTLSHLRSQAQRNANSSERWRECRRDIELLEAKTENCELRFLSLRQHLRVLHASAPILIALGKLSNAAWNTMLDQLVYYEDAQGSTEPMIIRMEAVENIVADQLASIKDFYAELRILQTTILQNELQERKLDEEIVLASLNAVKNSVDELTKRMDSYPMRRSSEPAIPQPTQNTIEHQRRPEPAKQDQAERIKIKLPEPGSKYEKSVLKFLQGLMEARKQVNEKRVKDLLKKLQCRPREFKQGLGRDKEAHMGCVFCGARGIHYSDSCPILPDSTRRRFKLQEERRCLLCLEVGCEGKQSCPKSRTSCYHCKQTGHHSAVCEKPD